MVPVVARIIWLIAAHLIFFLSCIGCISAAGMEMVGPIKIISYKIQIRASMVMAWP